MRRTTRRPHRPVRTAGRFRLGTFAPCQNYWRKLGLVHPPTGWAKMEQETAPRARRGGFSLAGGCILCYLMPSNCRYRVGRGTAGDVNGPPTKALSGYRAE
jgi:hypothetical protein